MKTTTSKKTAKPLPNRRIALVPTEPRTVDEAITTGQESIARTRHKSEVEIRFQLHQALENLDALDEAIPLYAGNLEDETVGELLQVRECSSGIRGSLAKVTRALDDLHNATLLPGEEVAS
jgi:hypothetical protein